MSFTSNAAEFNQDGLYNSNLIQFPTSGIVKRKVAANGTVDPVKSLEDIQRIKEYFLNGGLHAYRNYCMFVVGINVGLRASDLLPLRVCDVAYLSQNGKLEVIPQHTDIRLKEKKTAKYRSVQLSQNAREAIQMYFDNTSWLTINDYLFASQKGGHIELRRANQILKEAQKDLNLNYNLGTHSMRKTFGYQKFEAMQETQGAIATLQKAFNHSSSQITLGYIGIT